MRIQELTLRSFRNYAEQTLAPGEGINILVGENAQGKSNLLEAVHLLATTRSLRASRESEMVQRGAESAAVAASVMRERNADVDLELSIFPTDKKSVRINTVRRPRVLELLGQLNAVYFGAIDLAIVSGEPSDRRRWLNLEISQISPKYVFDLAGYKKVLEQRNRLLRDMRERPSLRSGLEAWTEQMVRYGAPLIERRRFFVEHLAPIARQIHCALTDGRETLTVRYVPNVPLSSLERDDLIAEAFRNEMQRVAGEELRRGVTLAGPQRDDLQFVIDRAVGDRVSSDGDAAAGADARTYGSQGQQRTVVLSLKLAELRLMEEYVGERPVLLLDDVMSDLDDARRSHLLDWTASSGGQTFLTCTSLRSFPSSILDRARVFRVTAGSLSEAPAKEPTTSEDADAQDVDSHAA